MNARQRLLQLVSQHHPPTDLANLSRAMGRNHAYLQQYIKRGVPQTLPEKLRYKLAELLGVHHSALLEEEATSYVTEGMAESPGIPFQHAPCALLQSGAHKQIIRKEDTYYLAGVQAESEHAFALEVKDISLNLSGFVPGDVVISALNQEAGDARFVIAQHYTGDDDAQTLIRAWRAPYLMPHSTDSAYQPLHMDEVEIRIVAPVLKKITLF